MQELTNKEEETFEEREINESKLDLNNNNILTTSSSSALSSSSTSSSSLISSEMPVCSNQSPVNNPSICNGKLTVRIVLSLINSLFLTQ
jgi:hypothetical protein